LFTAILILSAAGGGWVPALLAVIFVLLARNFKRALPMIVAIIVTASVTDPFWYKANWFEVTLPFQNLLDRGDFWKATLLALKDHLFTGLGLCGWWSRVNTSITPGGPHNSYLQLYSDCGPVGLIALFVVIFIGIKLAKKVLHADKTNPYFGLTLGFLAGCIAASAYAVIENIFVVFIPINQQDLTFTVPLVWLLLAGLILSTQKLLRDENTDT
jgi:O-antigen ligase